MVGQVLETINQVDMAVLYAFLALYKYIMVHSTVFGEELKEDAYTTQLQVMSLNTASLTIVPQSRNEMRFIGTSMQ